MNILNKVTWQAMWKNKTRTVVTIIGVIFSAAMFMAVTTGVFSLWSFLVRGYEYETGDFFISFDFATQAQYAQAKEDPKMEHVADFEMLGYYNFYDSVNPSGTFQVGAVDEVFLREMPVPLLEGRLPQTGSEIVIPERLNDCRRAEGELPLKTGDEITLSLFSKYVYGGQPELYDAIPDTRWDASYTVVGIMEDRNYRTEDENAGPGFPCMLTLADGTEGTALWHRLFVKTKHLSDAAGIQGEDYGERAALNRDLLNLYGFTGASNQNWMLLLLGLVLVLIIMGASVSLIGNAFSISVSERTKQFGLLSSVGATKKQIRRSVRYEAMVILALGVPAGLLLGFWGIAIVLRLYGVNLTRLFSFGVSGGVALYAVFSLPSAITAIAVCALTVLISARVPARRATRITPMEAIRQKEDYRVESRKRRSGEVAGAVFGIPGFLGARYYQNSRKKYRATIAALAVSLVLFAVSGYFCGQVSLAADAQNTNLYDFSVYVSGSNYQQVYDELRSAPGVDKAAITTDLMLEAAIPTAGLDPKYQEVMEGWAAAAGTEKTYHGKSWSCETVYLLFLEDAVFEEHLRGEGIDPAPYRNAGGMLAVTFRQTLGTYYAEDENGQWGDVSFYGYPVTRNAGTIRMLPPPAVPEELGLGDYGSPRYEIAEDGTFLLVVSGYTVDEDGVMTEDRSGETWFCLELTPAEELDRMICGYHSYDPETGRKGDTVLASETLSALTVETGARLDSRPFGIELYDGISFVLPLSRYPYAGDGENPNLTLNLTAKDHDLVLAALKEHSGDIDYYTDYGEGTMNLRGIATLLRVFSAGFLVLICLICCANVFNTISTNVALRRRDFGMLRSLGLCRRDLYGMMAYECLHYCFQTVVWGVPVSLLLCFGVYRVTSLQYLSGFEAPWGSLAVGLAIIMAVVLASMLYALGKLRKDNPIDAIRAENL